MTRTFLERWYGDDGVVFDIVFDEELARFEVASRSLRGLGGERIVFSAGALAEVLHWCMRPASAPEPAPAEAIELSPWEPED